MVKLNEQSLAFNFIFIFVLRSSISLAVLQSVGMLTKYASFKQCLRWNIFSLYSTVGNHLYSNHISPGLSAVALAPRFVRLYLRGNSVSTSPLKWLVDWDDSRRSERAAGLFAVCCVRTECVPSLRPDTGCGGPARHLRRIRRHSWRSVTSR